MPMIPLTDLPVSPERIVYKSYLGVNFSLVNARNIWGYFIDKDNFSYDFSNQKSALEHAHDHVAHLLRGRVLRKA